jgi:DNA-binding CsgD family transcriptional regulator/PAS domain-containing protein
MPEQVRRASVYGWLAMLTAIRVLLEHPDEAGLRALTDLVSLPAGIIDLRARRLVLASPQVPRVLGLPETSGHGVDLHVLVEDPDTLGTLLDLVADGDVTAYETRRGLRRGDGVVVAADNWVTASQWADGGLALWVFAPLDDPAYLPDPPPASAAWPERISGVAVGLLDAGLRIERIGPEVVDVLGRTSDEVVGTALTVHVHPDDVAGLLGGIARALAERTGINLRVRVAHRTGTWRRVVVVVTPLDPWPAQLGIVLVPDTEDRGDDTDRVAQLEQRLWRIAGEVEAAGVTYGLERTNDPRTLPGLRELSPRQWEVLRRLLRGERVPGIAEALFLSQSTIRNHLTAIFRRVGVNSQAELIEVLRGRRAPPDARTDGPPRTR